MASDRIDAYINCPSCNEQLTVPARLSHRGDGTATLSLDTSAVQQHIDDHHDPAVQAPPCAD